MRWSEPGLAFGLCLGVLGLLMSVLRSLSSDVRPLPRMRRLTLTLAAALTVFAVANAASYFFSSESIPQGTQRFGFPAIVCIWEKGSFAQRHAFDFVALLIDFGVAVLAGLLFAIIYSRMRHEDMV